MRNSLLIFVVSVLLYIFSPDVYSHFYCIILLIVFIISSVLTIRYTVINNNFFNFHVLFLTSFFFVNFVYPVFLYPVNPYHFSVFNRPFDHNLITKSTSLALFAASAYGLGATVNRNILPNRNFETTNYKTLHFFTTIQLYFLFFALISYGGINLLSGIYGSTLKIPAGLLTLFQVVLGIAVILSVYKNSYTGTLFDFIRNFDKEVALIIFIFISLFILTGDRGPVIQIVLIIITLYALFIKSVRLKYLVFLLLSSMIILTFISYARHPETGDTNQKGVTLIKGIKNFEMNSFFDIGMDLIVCNRNLYFGYEYVKEEGFSYGKNIFFYFFAPVPLLPSFLSEVIFHASPDELSSANIITKNSKSPYGLGTNLVADIYMAFGSIGVLFLMSLLGFLVRRFQIDAYSKRNLYSVVVYVFLVSFAVYLPRTSIFEPFRHIVWAIVTIWVLKALRISLIRLSNKN